MASGLTTSSDRRLFERLLPADFGCHQEALLRPGQAVLLIDVSAGGARLESIGRITPGARAELQITSHSRRYVRGRIIRSRVVRLAPICYEAAMAFDEPLRGDADEERHG